MGRALAQVRIKRTNGIPADDVVNTFHFATDLAAVSDADATTMTTRLIEFYTVSPGGAGELRLDSYLSNVVATTAVHEIRIYDQGQPEPRVPKMTTTFSLLNGGEGLPSEVALCLSFRAALISGQNPARRRGRIYFGPIAKAAVATSAVAGDVRPTNPFMQSLAGAGKRLADYNDPVEWIVWSKAGNVAANVLTCWVDNAFDTQRRRGASPTTRYVD